jgi:RNA 2',3'-cyclic 3'-phosphodiesterase
MRAFIALPLPLELQQSARRLQEELAVQLPEVRWVRPEQIHLTLRFFPDLAEEYLDPIREIMLSVGNFCAPFTVHLEGVGAFPGLTRPRVLWLGLTPAQPLIRLQQQLDTELGAIGLAEEKRAFKPHLTLGRFKGGGRRRQPLSFTNQKVACGSWRIKDMICFQSRLSATGAIHTPLIQVALSGSDRH